MPRQRLQTSQTEMGGQDEGREMPFKIGLSGDEKGQGQRWTTWARRRILTHAAVGRVEDACVHNDDGNVECVESALLRRSSQVDLHVST